MQAGFDKLPTLAGNGSKLVQINSGGTAMAAIALTVGAILFGGAAGVLGQDANLTYTTGTQTLAVPKVSASTSVVTPLVQASAGLVVNANVGDINFQTAGTRRWNILNSTSALQPDQDNVWNFGAATSRIASGFFGTSVVTPLIFSSTTLQFGGSGGAQWQVNGDLLPINDNTAKLGLSTNRIAAVFTPIIDSGTTGSLSLKTNNGTTQAIFNNSVGHQFNQDALSSSATFGNVIAEFRTNGSGRDATINLNDVASTSHLISGRSGTISFGGFGPQVHFQVLGITGTSTRNITVTGSNGGNPTLSTTAGSLAITPAVVLASSLTFSTAAGKIIPGATSFALRNTADSADNLLLVDAGDATFRTKITMPGPLVFTSAASKIVPGATSLSLRNNADSADNLLVTDAGVATVRSSLAWGTGVANFGTITKRKTADESVTSSTVLQNDDHLTFSIAASEEWVAIFEIDAGAALNTTGFTVAVTVPSGATLNASGSGSGNAASAQGSTTTSGTAFLTSAGFVSTTGLLRVIAWVLNGATPGSVTLQWAQGSSSGTALTFKKGSFMQATRIA